MLRPPPQPLPDPSPASDTHAKRVLAVPETTDVDNSALQSEKMMRPNPAIDD